MPAHRKRVVDPAERERAIVDSARSIAESDGWPAVTTRRLADEIGYSQPVLYGHFPDGKVGIRRMVALDGIRELTTVLAAARARARSDRQRLVAVAEAYLEFGRQHPATYEAMFTLQTGLPFADPLAPQELHDAFAELGAALPLPASDPLWGARTEVLWATLHGLVTLTRDGRLSDAGPQRIGALVDQLLRVGEGAV
ncbi:TetR/AcrR family transcriptional regulator [Nakamurella lactea]|uniref:TetR/AcrR family transcriptional regulator n=1 Tax=Nakamurella lactea TaxID=459515 RepID=UPI00048E9CEF|nr:TetR/AcrR family transcriptional regulator [Nakamurella lactea]